MNTPERTGPSGLLRLRRHVLRGVAAITALLAVLLGSFALTAPPASANASGCSYEYGFHVPYIGVYIPTTGVCVNIAGSGLSATSFSGQFVIKACNFQIKLERYDSANVRRLVNSGPFVTGCHTDVRNHVYTIRNVGLYNGGKACAALYMAGALADRACVYTYREQECPRRRGEQARGASSSAA